MDINTLIYDDEKVKNGVPVPIGGDAVLYVGRSGVFCKRWNEALLKYQLEIAQAAGNPGLERIVMSKVFADGCLYNFEGLEDGDNTFEYSEENARKLLEKSEPIYEIVVAASRNSDNYLRKAEERLGESSAKKSSGKLSTRTK